MEKKIPYVFEDAVIYQPLSPTDFSNNIGRTRVRAFYKYANRNGSYITDQVAEYLIQTAPGKPVVGFYNYLNQDFEGHTTPELAKGYGYIAENPNFAWEEHLDKDGITRTYACFDVVLHVDYWEEAKQIIGKAQSMELDTKDIQGTWNIIDGQEYFVYSMATMKGFCVLGDSKEPCFEGSAFENAGDSKFEKFSLLLTDLMEKVKEAENKSKEGGERKMNFTITGIENEHYTDLFSMLNEKFNEENNFEVDQIIYSMDDNNFNVFSCADGKRKKYSYTIDDEGAITYELVEEIKDEADMTEFEALQAKFDELQISATGMESDLKSLQEQFEAAQQDITVRDENLANVNSAFEAAKAQFEEEKTAFEATIASLNEKIAEYEAAAQNAENERKEEILNSYEEVLSEEEIAPIKTAAENFSYDELESHLAAALGRKQMVKGAAPRVPQLDSKEQPTEFAKLMEKYKK